MSELTMPRARGFLPEWDVRSPAREVIRSRRYLVYRRAALGVATITVAFHYTLSTLVRTLNNETPLAYLGLVPIIALLLGAARLRPEALEPPIHDRQVDYIIGVPLLLAAMAFEIYLPIRMSTLFWLYRLDLLALPIFVSGVICLLFGTRALWRLRIPVLFLVLAWPLPYTTFLVNWLTAFTNSTLWGLNVVLRVAHVAAPDPAQGLGTYLVRHGGEKFPVSIASACSGVNGAVGYLLVALAFLTVISGSWVRKALWLGVGLVGTWTSNVVRIFLILAVGQRWGEKVAIDVLHPIAGLVLFNVIIVTMVVLRRRFGLTLRFSGSSTTVAQLTDNLHGAVPRVRLVGAVFVVVAVLGYLANSSLRQFDLVVSSLGAPRLTSLSDSPTSPAGWDVVRSDTYTWAKPYFGNDSTWFRYRYTSTAAQGGALQSSSPVISDVINTSDVTTFSTYGLEACYRFHGYQLHSIQTVDLGAGVTGNVLAYYNPATKSDWTTLYFHWPVKTATGKIRYERVTFMMLNTADATFTGPALSASGVRALGVGFQNAIRGKSTVDVHLAQTRTFLMEFAHAIILRQASVSTGAGAPRMHA